MTRNTLESYLQSVGERLSQLVEDPLFHPTQRALLRETVALYRKYAGRSPLGDPLSVVRLVAMASGRAADEQAVHVGAFCALYLLAADLLDDVQDEDLGGKPHAEAGPALASNDAVTLLFLGLRELTRALELEPDAERRLEYLRLVHRVSLSAVAGQHVDLLGDQAAGTPEDVLQMAAAKTSSLALLLECGALLGRCSEEERRRYGRFGETLAAYVQVRDDVRDVFGKARSPDLETGKLTYLIACFRQVAGDADQVRFDELTAQLPASLTELRELLYRSGAVQASAATMERLRGELHGLLAETRNAHGAHRVLLELVDSIAATVYEPASLPCSEFIRRPQHGWHAMVRETAEQIRGALAPYDPPPLPTLQPWSQPHWMYAAGTETLYYPDLEDLSAELLPWQAHLLGEEDLEVVRGMMVGQLPAVVAHELTHHWRDVSGKMSRDHWHEEWVANSVAVALMAEQFPAVSRMSRRIAERGLALHWRAVPAACEEVLERCRSRGGDSASGYGMDALATALTTLEMVRRLSEHPAALAACVQEWLAGPPQSMLFGRGGEQSRVRAG